MLFLQWELLHSREPGLADKHFIGVEQLAEQTRSTTTSSSRAGNGGGER